MQKPCSFQHICIFLISYASNVSLASNNCITASILTHGRHGRANRIVVITRCILDSWPSTGGSGWHIDGWWIFLTIFHPTGMSTHASTQWGNLPLCFVLTWLTYLLLFFGNLLIFLVLLLIKNKTNTSPPLNPFPNQLDWVRELVYLIQNN